MLHEKEEQLNAAGLSFDNMLEQAQSILSQAQSMQVADPFEYETAVAFLKIIATAESDVNAVIDLIQTLFSPIKNTIKSAEETIKAKLIEYDTRIETGTPNILKILEQDIKAAEEAGDIVSAELYAQRKRELAQRAITEQHKKNNEVSYDPNQSNPRSIDLVGQPV